MEQKSGAQFLHEKDTRLQQTEDVQRAVERKNRRNAIEYAQSDHDPDLKLEKLRNVPNNPEARIQVFIDRLEAVFPPMEKLQDSPESIEKVRRNLEILKPFIYEGVIIKPGDVPESYWRLQAKIARERGELFPDEITDTMRIEAYEKIAADQKQSLDNWLEYLSGPDAAYPSWYKVFVLKSILGLAEYDKSKKTFPKRTKTTTKMFPDIQSEALTETLSNFEDIIQGKSVENPIPEPKNPHASDEKKAVSDAEFQALMQSTNFAKFYAFHIEHSVDYRELWPVTEGEWKKFERGQGEEFVSSIQGKGTGWCSAGAATANTQLEGGDFYVYFSKNKLGESTIPRLAIRMRNDDIAEVRGVDKNQNTDPYINPVLEEKLQDFGKKGEKYTKRAADMERLSAIETNRTPDAELCASDLRFLYELDDKIEGFNQFGRKDPRIAELLKDRDISSDMATIFQTDSEVATTEALLADSRSGFLMENIKHFKKVTPKLAYRLCKTGGAGFAMRHFDRFDGLDQHLFLLKALENHHSNREVFKSRELLTEVNNDEFIDLAFNAGAEASLCEYRTSLGLENDFSLVERLLKTDEGRAGLARYIDRFKSMPKQDLADLLIKQGDGVLVLQNYENYENFDDQLMAEIVLFSNPEILIRKLDTFERIEGTAVFEKLIEKGHLSAVVEHADVFVDVSKQELAERLLELDRGLLLEEIDYFSETDVDFVSLANEALNQRGLSGIHAEVKVVSAVSKLKKEDAFPLLQQVVNRGCADEIGRRIRSLPTEWHQELSKMIAERALSHDDHPEESSYLSVVIDLEGFEVLDQSMIEYLLKVQEYREICYRLRKVPGVEYQTVADNLPPMVLIEYISYFRNLTQETAVSLLKNYPRNTLSILKNLDVFQITNSQTIADLAIQNGFSKDLGNGLPQMSGLSAETGYRLLEDGNHYNVAEHLERFPDIDHDRVAERLIVAGSERLVSDNLEKFKNLSEDMLIRLIESHPPINIISIRDFDQTSFDQDRIAEAILNVTRNVHFCGVVALEKYSSLTGSQLSELHSLSNEMRAEAAKRMIAVNNQ